MSEGVGHPVRRGWFRGTFPAFREQDNGMRRMSFARMSAARVAAGVTTAALALVAGQGRTPGVAGRGQAEPRNVLVIIADDLGVDTMAIYGIGQEPAHTPTLDGLAAAGLRFEQAWAYPICTPFRAAALTGRFGFRTGVGAVGAGSAATLPLAETIVPEVLDAHPELGVTHAVIGKWHLGGGRTAPLDHGFDHFAGVLQGSLPDYYAWQRSVNGRVATETGYATSVQVDDASAWIAQQADRPWFMWLAFNAPHSPFHRPPEDLHTVDLPPGDPPDRGSGATPYYLAAIEAMDSEIGRLLREMDPAVRARTTLLFMGDNGSPARTIGAPFDAEKSKDSLYQGGIRTPLIISGAGVVEPGRQIEHLVHSVDLMATSLDLLGVPEAELPTDIDGRSLRPYLETPGHPALRDWAFSEKFGSEDGPAGEGKTLRDLRYKYIRFDAGGEELYDLLSDPYERQELIAAGLDAAGQAALDDLRTRLDALLAGPPVTATPATPPGSTPTAPPTSSPGATPTAGAGQPTQSPEPESTRVLLPLLWRSGD